MSAVNAWCSKTAENAEPIPESPGKPEALPRRPENVESQRRSAQFVAGGHRNWFTAREPRDADRRPVAAGEHESGDVDAIEDVRDAADVV